MSAQAAPVNWEENTERRIGIAESKIDKILDPETGIYPKLSALEGRLRSYVITILLAIIGSGAVSWWHH